MMQGTISYHVVPPGNLRIQEEDGFFRDATDVETNNLFRSGAGLSSGKRLNIPNSPQDISRHMVREIQ